MLSSVTSSCNDGIFFFFKQRTASEIRLSLVVSDMCIRARLLLLHLFCVVGCLLRCQRCSALRLPAPVSYTQLTLPTNREVYITVVAVLLQNNNNTQTFPSVNFPILHGLTG